MKYNLFKLLRAEENSNPFVRKESYFLRDDLIIKKAEKIFLTFDIDKISIEEGMLKIDDYLKKENLDNQVLQELNERCKFLFVALKIYINKSKKMENLKRHQFKKNLLNRIKLFFTRTSFEDIRVTRYDPYCVFETRVEH